MKSLPFILFLLILLASGCHLPGCGGQKKSLTSIDGPLPGDQSGRPSSKAQVRFVEDENFRGLRMHLREAGPPRDEGGPANKVATGKPLSEAQAKKLLARLPDIGSKSTDKKDFAMRKGSAPPPKTGKRVAHAFPPKTSPGAPELGKPGILEVLRHAPEGNVPLAPHLSITFSKPMVAVTSQHEAARNVPAKLSPTPEGSWRWLGTRTLQFKPKTRFPMATQYKVAIKKGTKAATGEPLGKAVDFQFTTPPPKIVQSYPNGGPHTTRPVIYIEFDQKIDQADIAEQIAIETKGDNISFRRAASDEIEADDVVRVLVQNAEKGRYITLKLDSELPKDSYIKITLKKGTPSAEGPLRTTSDQSFTFRTYAPLRIVRHGCGWRDECTPDMNFRIAFNNPLDLNNFDPNSIETAPAIPGSVANGFGQNINIQGRKQGRTRYKVTIPASITDTFGQQLEKPEELSFHVGPAEKTLFGPGKMLVTLDPTGPPAFPVHTVNHSRIKVLIHRVAPKDWVPFREWLEKYRYEDKRPGPLPGKRVYAKTLKTKGENDRLVETPIDLKPHLNGKYGQFIIKVEPTNQPKEQWLRQEVLAWVQVTDIGITAFSDYEELIAWTTALKNGSSLKGVEVRFLPGEGQTGASSDETGLARLDLLNDSEKGQLLVAKKGKDAAILPSNPNPWYGGGGFGRVVYLDEIKWYTFDDRGLYRPGENARIKGWIRRDEPRKKGDLHGFKAAPGGIEWTLRGPRGNKLGNGVVKLSRLFGFDIAIDLPKDVNLGTARLELTARNAGNLSNTTHVHAINIQEFRRPEFEVKTEAKPGPYVLGEEAVVSVNAAYYAGGGLPNAPVTWRAYAKPSHYVPPNCGDYQFGPWQPWWMSRNNGGPGGSETLKGKTDASGQHHLGIHFESMNPKRPMTVKVEANVSDVNRQTWTASHTILLHPADIYVGLKTEQGFVELGAPIKVDAIAADIDGNLEHDVPVLLTMARLDWKYKQGAWQEVETDKESCEVSSSLKPKTCTFTPKIGGAYRISALVRDVLGRKNQTDLRIWVAGGQVPPSRDVKQEKLTLIPEKQVYQPGETASLLVQSPFFPAEAIMTIRRSGLVETKRFALKSATDRLEIPIDASLIPNFSVQVDAVGSAVRSDDAGRPKQDLPRRVAYATGAITFQVPPLERTLELSVKPKDKILAPGGKTSIDLLVRDSRGKPVKNAELAVVVADESVLALTGYKVPDPIQVFYAARGAGVRDKHSREFLLLSDPSKLVSQQQNNVVMMSGRGGAPQPSAAPPRRAMKKSAVKEKKEISMAAEMAMTMKDDEAPEKPATTALRTDFSALALFAPNVKTNGKGRATVALKLPDSLTRYRVTVVAVAGEREFGTGEANVTARLPLMVRPSAPRFLNFGDRFLLPVVIQNQTDRDMKVEVAVRATNASLARTLDEAAPGRERAGASIAGQAITVGANDRVEVRFGAAAAMAGTARFQVVGVSGKNSDAKEFDLPVWTPATAEAFATYGTIDKGVLVQPVTTPKDVWPQFGSLEISTSSTQLQALTDAFLYLVSYPFDCNEQIASRILSIAALRDVLQAFQVKGIQRSDELKKSIDKDLKRLEARQNYNGGFSFWRRGDRDWPYLTVHVSHAISRAKKKGYKIPKPLWNRSLGYLRKIKSHIPGWYSKESAWAIRAYALYVRNLMGDTDTKKASELHKEAGVKNLPTEAKGWLLSALANTQETKISNEILSSLNNKVTETAAGAHFVTGYSDGAHVLLHSNRRVDGILLEALIDTSPKNDLIPKLVRGLLGHRKAGRWSNTQENVFILLALDRYFHVFEKVTPNFVARAWLGENFAGEHTFKGRTTEEARFDIPMSTLVKGAKSQSLILEKAGKGRLYYRVGMRYAPKDLKTKPADYGFAINRVFEPVDEKGDVKREKDGTWSIRAGARVRIRLTMASPMRRYHVALIDPLPAGLEAINPELAVSGETPEDPNSPKKNNRYWWWSRPWYEHQNMRDERVEAFTSLLWAGVHEYTYIARATTPGVFVVPPTRAEEMYHPETFGRSGTDTVVVE